MGLRDRLASLFSTNGTSTPSRVSWSAPGAARRGTHKGSLLLQDNSDATRHTSVDRSDRFSTEAERPASIDLEDLEQAYRQEPFLRRAILKHSQKLIAQWFQLETPEGEKHPEDEAFQDWARRAELREKLKDIVISSHVYGDGFLELAWSDGGSREPVTESAILQNVFVVDPTQVHLFTSDEGGRDDVFLVEEKNAGRSDLTLHPDRYEQLVLHDLPGYLHGLATVEAAWHAAHSKVMADQAVGEILFHCGVPFRHAKIAGGDDDETDKFTEFLNRDEVIRGFASDETIDISQLNPETVDPGAYYDALVESVAAAVGVPKVMVRGAQAGSVTGSELNRDQFHDDLSDLQESVLTPIVRSLAESRLGLDRDGFRVAWHAFGTDPADDADIKQTKARAFQHLVSSGVPPRLAADIVDLPVPEDAEAFQAPEWMREGTIPPGGGV